MTAYPAMMPVRSMTSPRSSEANSAGRPRATITTPTICTAVSTRKSQSSVTNADVNHVKFTQAHATTSIASRNPPIAEAV